MIGRTRKRGRGGRRATKDVSLPALYRPARRGALIGGLAAAGVALGATVMLADLPGRIWRSTAGAVAHAGLEVKRVEIDGVHYLTRLDVYSAVLAGPSASMLDVDLSAARLRLKRLPWVADASVARALPDRLLVHVVERAPFALWRTERAMAVIDEKGQILDRRNLKRFADLPLLYGEGANVEAARLWPLLATQPELHARVAGAGWIGRRRWDVRFRSGEVLALPEGYAAARKALARFAAMEREAGLLDRGFVRFDMRLADRLVVRKTGSNGPATPGDMSDRAAGKAAAGVTGGVAI